MNTYTDWTDAQLEVAARFDPAAQIELDGRTVDDGSRARVAALAASTRRPRRRTR